VSEYQELVDRADVLAQSNPKDAYNTYAAALVIGGDRDEHCRRQRGKCCRRVAEVRLDRLSDYSSSGITEIMMRVVLWLTKAEAYLTSAKELADEAGLAEIEQELELLETQKRHFTHYYRELIQRPQPVCYEPLKCGAPAHNRHGTQCPVCYRNFWTQYPRPRVYGFDAADELVPIQEVSNASGCRVPDLHELILAGKLPAEAYGKGIWWVRRGCLVRFLRAAEMINQL
jgi:hypothetical protein